MSQKPTGQVRLSEDDLKGIRPDLLKTLAISNIMTATIHGSGLGIINPRLYQILSAQCEAICGMLITAGNYLKEGAYTNAETEAINGFCAVAKIEDMKRLLEFSDKVYSGEKEIIDIREMTQEILSGGIVAPGIKKDG